MNEELKKLRESLASIEKELKAAAVPQVADHSPTNPEIEKRFSDLYNHMCNMAAGLRNYMYAMESDMYQHRNDHGKGHLPPIKGADKMQKALKALGMDGDYQVAKPTVYCNASTRGLVIEAEYIKPEEK